MVATYREGTLGKQEIYRILHVSHTDISRDSRILKELTALSVNEAFVLTAIGVDRNDRTALGRVASSVNFSPLTLNTRKFHFIPKFLRYGLNFVELFFKIVVHSLAVKPHVIHCHDNVVLPSAVLVKLLTGCKLVYDAHELESDKNNQSFIASKVIYVFEKLIWCQVDLLISVNEAITGWYRQAYGAKTSIVVMNSPQFTNDNVTKSLNNLDLCHDYFHRAFSIPADAPVFVYLGILMQGRGIDHYLKCFADATLGAHVVFVGYGPWVEKVQAYSKAHDTIHYHNPVPHERVVELATSASYGLCLIENASLSDYLCLPNKLFEYAFAGLPIVASDFPEISRLVKSFCLGMCVSPDAESLKAAVKKIVAQPMERGFKDLTPLAWQTQAETLRNGYSSLLGLGPDENGHVST